MEKKFSQSSAGTTLLKSVSRSFYLSLRLLPRSMRDAAGLGYLLARSSDTIADTASTPVADRLHWLDDFSKAIHHGTDYTPATTLLNACTPSEKILLENTAQHFHWLQTLPTAEQALVREVLDEIISGQRLDLERFGNATATSRMVIADDAALLDYCQRVAGSVGAFWTKLGFLGEGERFSRESEPTMLHWGKNFGCGLQLVNILRDRPEDLRAGRCYLPGTTDIVPGDDCLHAHDRWLVTAKNFIDDGLRYADALRGRRLRCATVLPALLALETIEKMQTATWPQMEQRVKISRPTVFRCLAEAMLF